MIDKLIQLAIDSLPERLFLLDFGKGICVVSTGATQDEAYKKLCPPIDPNNNASLGYDVTDLIISKHPDASRFQQEHYDAQPDPGDRSLPPDERHVEGPGGGGDSGDNGTYMG